MMFNPQRQHVSAMLFFSISFIRYGLFPLVLSLISMLKSGDYFIWIAAVAGGVLFFAVGWGILTWARYTYQVVEGELRIEEGVFIRERRFIPLERIQAIDLTENLLHRLFGVVQVNVETAGGTGPEVSLIAVKREKAERLRELLTKRDAVETTPEEPTQTIKHLSARQLLLAGVTSDRIGIALSFLGVLFSGLDYLLDWLVPLDSIQFPSEAQMSTSTVIGVVILSVLALVCISWGIVIAATVFTYAGFTVQRKEKELLIERGLFERRRSTIPLNRIQAIRIVEGVLRQPFGLVALYVESAGYGVDADAESTILFPLLRRKEVDAFLAQFTPEFAAKASIQSLPRRALRRYIVRSLLPLLFPIAVVTLFFFPLGLLSLLLLFPVVLWGWLKYRDTGWGESEGRLLLRFRRFARITAIVPRRRIQSTTLSSSPFQRRVQLATIRVNVASGASFRVAHIEAETGELLLEWMGRGRLRKKEVNNKIEDVDLSK